MNKNIEYTISDIEKLRNDFKKNNLLIIEKLKILEKEYSTISDVLSTPNSNNIMPELYNLIKRYDEYTTENGLYFDGVFNTAIDEYDNFIKELKDSIRGGK